jgi:hypothetical protein
MMIGGAAKTFQPDDAALFALDCAEAMWKEGIKRGVVYEVSETSPKPR